MSAYAQNHTLIIIYIMWVAQNLRLRKTHSRISARITDGEQARTSGTRELGHESSEVWSRSPSQNARGTALPAQFMYGSV